MTDPIIAAARFLQAHLDWLRHRSATEIQECFADIAAAARVVAGIARGPSEQKYLGPCGAIGPGPKPCCEIHNEHCEPPGDLCCYECTEAAHDMFPIPHADGSRCVLAPCDGDVYGRPDAATGTCRTCGATVNQEQRRIWLDEEVRAYAYTPSEITQAYPEIKRNTINQWASRGRLTAHGHDGNGRARYNLGDVLDLAAAEAARRESARAERERRAAARVAT